MVAALITSMMIDSRLINFFSQSLFPAPLLHAIAETNIGDRQSEKCNRHCYPKNVFHHRSPLSLQLPSEQLSLYSAFFSKA
jgi:hypothetical protein